MVDPCRSEDYISTNVREGGKVPGLAVEESRRDAGASGLDVHSKLFRQLHYRGLSGIKAYSGAERRPALRLSFLDPTTINPTGNRSIDQ